MGRKNTTLILCIFLGYLGAHRFYNRKYASGVLYLFTSGLFGIGWFYDIYAIATDRFSYPSDTVNISNYRAERPIDYTNDDHDNHSDYFDDSDDEPDAFAEIDSLFPKTIDGFYLRNVYEMDVVGIRYNDIGAAWKLGWGDDIILMPFPSEYDTKGVKVLTKKKKHIGWIAKGSTYKNTIFNGINNGVPFPAKVFSVREYENLPYVKIAVGWYR